MYSNSTRPYFLFNDILLTIQKQNYSYLPKESMNYRLSEMSMF